MPFAQSRGASIHYLLRGSSGPAVVLVQGLGLSSRFWFDVPERLASDPARPRRVIVLDNRGTGRSERPVRPWTTATMADDVAAVLDHAEVDAAIVVGISMGGMISQEVALRHPHRVEGLVLMATTPGFVYGAFPQPKMLARLFSIAFGGPRAAHELSKLLLPESKWPRAKEIFRDWPDAVRDDPTSVHTFAMHLMAASSHLTAPRLASIACPTLVVAGEEDLLVPRRNAEALAARIPGAELLVLPDTGHAIFADDRDLVRRLVERVEQRAKTPFAADPSSLSAPADRG